jgi:TonB family protein
VRKLIFAVALVPALALADEQPAAQHVYVLPQNPNGRAHVCSGPPPSEGSVTFGLTITPDAAVKDVFIMQSSGDPALDRKTLDCVSAWHSDTPGMLDGKPIAVPRMGMMDYSVHRSNDRFASPTPRPGHPVPIRARANLVCVDDYPPDAKKACIQGIATMSYMIHPDGTVSDVTVAQSSGDASLDAASIRCARNGVTSRRRRTVRKNPSSGRPRRCGACNPTSACPSLDTPNRSRAI